MKTGPHKPLTDDNVQRLAKVAEMEKAVNKGLNALRNYVLALRVVSNRIRACDIKVVVAPTVNYVDIMVTTKYRHLVFFTKTKLHLRRLHGSDAEQLACDSLTFALHVIDEMYRESRT